MRARIQRFVITACSCVAASLAASALGFAGALGWPLSLANLAESALYGVGYGLCGGVILGLVAASVKKEVAKPISVLGTLILGMLVAILQFVLTQGNAAV